MSTMNFIKPTTPFEGAQFEGNGDIVGSGRDHWELSVGGRNFILRRWTWDNAFEANKWIKLGDRCTLTDASKVSKSIVGATSNKPAPIDESSIKTTLLGSVEFNPALYVPIKTGTFVDTFWSRKGGIMPGTITMVTGDPGIGKSSIMMDLLQGIKRVNETKKVLYVSAEMTLVDMLDPDEFMKFYPGLFDKVEFLFAGDFLEDEEGPSFSQALEIILQRGYDVVVFDSMIETQSICQAEMGLGSGKNAEKFMLNLMQKHVQGQNEAKRNTTFLLIQQVKKDGEFVGSRRLEHMITSFLSIKWDNASLGKKYMEFRKNRRGDVKRRLYFKFGPDGIVYDIEKYNDEIALGAILNADGLDLVEELTKDELSNLLTGKSNGSVPAISDQEDEDEE